LKKALAAANDAAFLPSTSIWISLEGSSRMIVNKRRAGSVVAPSRSTFASKLPAHADVEVGRRQVHFVAARLQQHIRENRQRRAGADHVLHLLQSLEQFLFRDAEFHEVVRDAYCVRLTFLFGNRNLHMCAERHHHGARDAA
jgi:hypothetical protein